MTTQEVFDNLEKSLTGKANVDIVGQPHTVPHGGIAIDARIQPHVFAQTEWIGNLPAVR